MAHLSHNLGWVEVSDEKKKQVEDILNKKIGDQPSDIQQSQDQIQFLLTNPATWAVGGALIGANLKKSNPRAGLYGAMLGLLGAHVLRYYRNRV